VLPVHELLAEEKQEEKEEEEEEVMGDVLATLVTQY